MRMSPKCFVLARFHPLPQILLWVSFFSKSIFHFLRYTMKNRIFAPMTARAAILSMFALLIFAQTTWAQPPTCFPEGVPVKYTVGNPGTKVPACDSSLGGCFPGGCIGPGSSFVNIALTLDSCCLTNIKIIPSSLGCGNGCSSPCFTACDDFGGTRDRSCDTGVLNISFSSCPSSLGNLTIYSSCSGPCSFSIWFTVTDCGSVSPCVEPGIIVITTTCGCSSCCPIIPTLCASDPLCPP